ncbi:uncharacterized protein LOC113279643 [Papaver somniferum]|uniref:uncharacterized protein LOC113279643 n=1 Tax=Papaver somniferum TaxID=3469 RepID=UPI000E6F92B5|nr:uncharacterized protein LOC113279643 [Papaver somniferum]
MARPILNNIAHQMESVSISEEPIRRKDAERAAKFIWAHLRRHNQWFVQVCGLEPNIFVIKFRISEDKDAILFGGARNLDGHLIVLKNWNLTMDYHLLDFTVSPFWLEYKYFLPEFTYADILRMFGNIVGEFRVIEPNGVNPPTSSKYRALVLINVNTPLITGIITANAACVARCIGFFMRNNHIVFVLNPRPFDGMRLSIFSATDSDSGASASYHNQSQPSSSLRPTSTLTSDGTSTSGVKKRYRRTPTLVITYEPHIPDADLDDNVFTTQVDDTVSVEDTTTTSVMDNIWDIAAATAYNAQNHTDAWQQVLLGDLNFTMHDSETHSSSVTRPHHARHVRNFVQQLGLIDLGYSGADTTWSNHHSGDDHVSARLDRALVNNRWINHYTNSHLQHLVHVASDHSPILLHTVPSATKHSPFKLYKCWFNMDSCTDTIARSCQQQFFGSPSFQFSCKLKLTRTRLQVKHLSSSLQLLIQKLTTCDKFLEADRNTSYFHSITNYNKRRSTINSIQGHLGIWYDNRSDIEAIFINRFKNIATSSKPQVKNEIMKLFHPCVSEIQNNCLIQVPDAQEIKDVVFQIKPWASPGNDGFQDGFYQRCWDIVSTEVISMLQYFFTHKHMLKAINHTYQVLIPEISNPKTPADYRSISLCNVSYKIISKILANRLKPLLPDIISPTQNAFVAGRHIHANIIIAHEILYSMKRKTIKKALVGLKLDMSKAFDRVEWSFLLSIFRQLGFHNDWISLIEQCISTSNISILINGSPSSTFSPTRGIRQGDPLSPYLFLFVTKAFSRILQLNVDSRCLSGIRINHHCPSINHMFFTDDCLLFFEADSTQMKHLQHLLHIFGQASGQVFKLAETTLQQMEIIQRSYWWNSYNKPRSQKYISWKKLLKGEHFPHHDLRFFPPPVNSNSSWIWQSISIGLEIVLKNVKCRVGNGAHINIWTSNWIPSLNYALQDWGDLNTSNYQLVSYLIDTDTEQWNVSLLSLLFTADQVNSILTIPIQLDQEDKLIRSFTTTGIFTTASAYKMLCDNDLLTDNSMGLSQHFWLSYWKLKVPYKFQISLWRAIHNVVPVKARIFNHVHNVDLHSVFCNHNQLEDLDHLLLHCPFTKEICQYFLPHQFHSILQHSSLLSWIQTWQLKDSIISIQKSPEIVHLGMCIMHFIWKLRCSFVFNNITPNHNSVVHQVTSYIVQHHLGSTPANYNHPHIHNNILHHKWDPPPMQYLKINIDASYNSSSLLAGIGIIIRNSTGAYVMGIGALRRASNIQQAEAWAMLEAMQLADSNGWSHVIFESDNLGICSFLKQQSSLCHWQSMPLLRKCVNICNINPVWSCSFVYRSSKKAADAIAN